MFGFMQPTIDTIGLFLISTFFALGTFGLPPSGRTLGRYPFHHKGRKKPMSSVACEGSHMKDFGGVGLREPPYTFPLFRVWSHRSTARSLV